MIEANSIYGNKIKIAKNKFKFRISVYGIIKNQDKILLVNTKSSGKYFFPGGGVEIGENLKDALKREVWEEAGIKIEIGKFIDFREDFFYYNNDNADNAWQNYGFYYECQPLTFDLGENHLEFDEAEKPQWIDINILKIDDFQIISDELFKFITKF